MSRLRPSPRVRSGILGLVALAIVAYVAKELVGSGSEMTRAGALLSRATFGWIGVAVVCEAFSYLAYATAQRRLARACGHCMNVRWLAMLSVTAQALNNFLPAGYVAANLLNFRELRRKDLGAGSAGWVLLTTSLGYIGALAALALIAVELPTTRSGAASADIGLAALVVLGGGTAAALIVLTLVRTGVLGRICRRRAAPYAKAAERFSGQLRAISLPKRAIPGVASLFVVCWLADAACLVASFSAIGIAPPWSSLLVAYCAAQLVSFVPITPGGVGLVEGSLTLALVAGGGTASAALAAVLLYRLISYWGTLPVGGIGYLVIRRTRSAADCAPAELAVVLATPVLDAGVS